MINIPLDQLSEEQKKSCYRSYMESIIYELGDNAKYMTYDEWCNKCHEICVMDFTDNKI